MQFGSCFVSPLGCGLVVASEQGLLRVELLPDTLDVTELCQTPSPDTIRAARLLERYFRGEQICFDLPLDLSGLPLFRQRILRLAARIPYGQVVTYGFLARQAEQPHAARAVGAAMAANPLPIIIPCHRVVAGSGLLSGYSGPGGCAMKKLLLRLEQVDFIGERIALKTDCFAQELLIQK